VLGTRHGTSFLLVGHKLRAAVQITYESDATPVIIITGTTTPEIQKMFVRGKIFF
jgi:hypothetical protein